MPLIGFSISDVTDEAKCKAVIGELEVAVIEVSEVRRGRARKVRRVESVCRMVLKKATLRGWNDCVVTTTKMLSKVEDIKADVSDVVNGFSW